METIDNIPFIIPIGILIFYFYMYFKDRNK
jgi:hypothetical protein